MILGSSSRTYLSIGELENDGNEPNLRNLVDEVARQIKGTNLAHLPDELARKLKRIEHNLRQF